MKKCDQITGTLFSKSGFKKCKLPILSQKTEISYLVKVYVASEKSGSSPAEVCLWWHQGSFVLDSALEIAKIHKLYSPTFFANVHKIKFPFYLGMPPQIKIFIKNWMSRLNVRGQDHRREKILNPLDIIAKGPVTNSLWQENMLLVYSNPTRGSIGRKPVSNVYVSMVVVIVLMSIKNFQKQFDMVQYLWYSINGGNARLKKIPMNENSWIKTKHNLAFIVYDKQTQYICTMCN